MQSHILITGGAGFIGSHMADELLRQDYCARALDNLSPQVHGHDGRPDYLSPEAELMIGDVRDPDAVRRALLGALADWLPGQTAVDRVARASSELEEKGLTL